jgi:hypothetical protein
LSSFTSLADAAAAIQALPARGARSRGIWNLPQVLNHIAQSIEYSMTGFPTLKPGWFRASVGPLALRVFAARGQMKHGLDQPIPGAPPLAEGASLDAAVRRVLLAIHEFDVFREPLQPHFAYGLLDKPAYAQAHLLHIRDHWREIR